jgi:gamma-glutamyltranspeptidase/glutathione hydrolase
MPGGSPVAEGELVVNPALARTLQRLAEAATGESRHERIDAARREWREGFVAEAIVRFIRDPHRHSTGGDHAGVITADDLAGFSAGYESAVTGEFRGHTIAKAGPWGQGPAILQSLAILAGFDDDLLDPSTGVGAHTILESQKLAFADREAYYGDGVDVPLDYLLSPEYADLRRRLITNAASLQLRPGTVPGVDAYLPPLVEEGALAATGSVSAAGTGEPTVASSEPTAAPGEPTGTSSEPTVAADGVTRGDTCHIDVIDRWGNIVSATPSGGWLQSNPTIPELGFCLGTRLQMTWLEPGTPSTLTPGLRPRTTLTPTIVFGPNESVTALGSPGGDQQDQWQLLYLLRTIIGGYTPQQAIDAPAFHSTAFPESFWPRTWTPAGAVVESRLPEAAIAELVLRGHNVTQAGSWSLGRLSAVGRSPSGLLFGAANPRGAQGYAAGR